jgi:hypothetical protein|tara:strand:+ start:70 stop:237 length:168 start_codon:yes stop_codon:yes gene_type:complete
MFRVQFRRHSPFEAWTTYGTYGTEATAVNAAISKKNAGAIMVKVTNKKKETIYVG